MNASNDQPQNFTSIDIWLRAFHGTILAILLVASVIGNSLVLLLVLCNKKLQYRSVVVCMGLVIADILISTSWTIQSIVNVIVGYSPFENEGCSILGAILQVAIYGRWCTIAVITLDRFCNILFHFWYIKWSKSLLIILTVLTWLISLAAIIPGLAGFGTFQFRLQHSACVIDCNDENSCVIFYIILYGTFLSIGGLLPMVLYSLLCIIGRRKIYKMNHMELGTNNATSQGTSVRKISTVSNETVTSSSSSSRSSNSSLKKVDSKAISTFFMIFINIFSTQLPIYITSALRSNEELYNSIPLIVHFIFVYIYLVGSILDPLLIIRNRDFKEVFNRILRRQAVRCSQNRNGVTNVLLELVKISSLKDVPPPSNLRSLRRNSCPTTTMQGGLAVQQLRKASSYTACSSLDTCHEESTDVQSVQIVLDSSYECEALKKIETENRTDPSS